MTFQVADIKTMQTGDLVYMSDDIFFAGCSRKCPYCFNKDIRDKSSGVSMSIEDITSKLSRVKWVCFIGGEPLEQHQKDMEKLIVVLKKMKKKVCIFTSYQAPWNIVRGANHYHVDIKTDDYDEIIVPPKGINVSFGLVSYLLSPQKLNKCFGDITDITVYVKTCQGYEEFSSPKTDYTLVKAMDIKNVFLDEKIKV